jgi:hypothetical protein
MDHPYGYIKDNKVFLKGFLNHPDRVIGEVKENEASTIKYFEDRFNTITEKINLLRKNIEENQNKGSFLMKLIHLRNSLFEFDALGDFVPLIEELNQLENYLQEIIRVNREKNLDIKNGLIDEAVALQNSTDWKETSEKYKELKLRWIKTGPVEKNQETQLQQEFNEAIETFYNRRKEYFEGMALQAEENIKIYEDLLQQAKDAYNLPDAKLAFEISKRIQKEWKASGKVPAEKRKPIWDEFSKLNNKIFSRFKRNAEASKALNPKDLVSKIENMASEIKKLAESESNVQVLFKAKKLQSEWKALPPKKPFEASLHSKNFVYFSEVVFEKAFVENLANSKHPDFREKPIQDQKKIKSLILRDLIQRDEKELETIKENSEKFNTSGNEFDMILKRKIGSYKRKIDAKKFIYQELSNKS